MASSVGTFSATGASAAPYMAPRGDFNVSLWVETGTFAATVILERRFDGGTWLPVSYIDGTALSWTGPVSATLSEYENGCEYRLRCTAYSGSPISYRISQ